MAIGFVLISAAPAHEHEVYNRLSNIPEIVELHALFGEYDVIAKIEAENYTTLYMGIINELRKMYHSKKTRKTRKNSS